MIEREKQIMEDEYGNCLTLNEDLQYQFDAIMKVSCQRCYQARAQSYGVTAFDQQNYLSNGSSQNGYQQMMPQRPSIIVEEAIESSMSNLDMTKTDKSLRKPIDQYNMANNNGNQAQYDQNEYEQDQNNNFRDEYTNLNNQNQIMFSTGVSYFGSGQQSGRSTNDITKSSPSNILSRMTLDSGATSMQNQTLYNNQQQFQNSGFMQGRRFTFSPMTGFNANMLNTGYQVIQESQNECESSFKTDNSTQQNTVAMNNNNQVINNNNNNNIDISTNSVTMGGMMMDNPNQNTSSNKDIVQQYFEFLYKENENLNSNIYNLEQQLEVEDYRHNQEIDEIQEKIKKIEMELMNYQSNQPKNLKDEMAQLEDFDF